MAHIDELIALESQILEELKTGLAQRAQLDEQLKEIRAKRDLVNKQVDTARAMLRLIETAKTSRPDARVSLDPAPVSEPSAER